MNTSIQPPQKWICDAWDRIRAENILQATGAAYFSNGMKLDTSEDIAYFAEQACVSRPIPLRLPRRVCHTRRIVSLIVILMTILMVMHCQCPLPLIATHKECPTHIVHAVCTPCKNLYVGNYPNPSFGRI